MWKSLISGLASGAAGSMLAGNNPAPSAPQLPYQDSAASNLYGNIASLTNPYGAMQPYEYQQLLAAMNNPNLAPYMQAAQRSGAMSTAGGNQAGAGANLLMQNAGQLQQQGFDPQLALYNRMKQQTQDQSNVTNAQYGLTSSPYGAGVAGQNLKNFNIDWQNQQLQRMLQAGQGIGRDVTGAQQLYGTGAQDYLAGGMTPYTAYNQGLGDINSAIGQYMTGAQQGNQFTQQPIGDWLQYLGMGQGATSLNQAGYGMNQNTAGMYGSALYPLFNQGFTSLGNMFSGSGTGSTSGGSGYTYTPPSNSGGGPITSIYQDPGMSFGGGG